MDDISFTVLHVIYFMNSRNQRTMSKVGEGLRRLATVSDGGEINTNMVGKLGGILNIKEISEKDNKRLCRHMALSLKGRGKEQ